MTTLAYSAETHEIGADTRLTYEDYYGQCNKILFPKKGVVLATAGDATDGEWLKHKLSSLNFNLFDLYNLADKPNLGKGFSAFCWYEKKPYAIFKDLNPMPIETKFWVGGTGGAFALAYLAIGMSMADALIGAAKIDYNSGSPVHVVKLQVPANNFKVEIYA